MNKSQTIIHNREIRNTLRDNINVLFCKAYDTIQQTTECTSLDRYRRKVLPRYRGGGKVQGEGGLAILKIFFINLRKNIVQGELI